MIISESAETELEEEKVHGMLEIRGKGEIVLFLRPPGLVEYFCKEMSVERSRRGDVRTQALFYLF